MKFISKALLILITTFSLAAFFLSGCSAPGQEAAQVSQDLISADSIVETGDAYIVEGDIAIGKESPNALQIALDLAAAGKATTETGSRGNLIPRGTWTAADRLDITYSYNTDMSMDEYSDANVRRMIEEALKTYSRMVNVNFRNVTSGAKLAFSRANANNGWVGMTTLNFTTTNISNAAVQYNYYYMKDNSKPRMMYTIYHEIGHAIGLHHEHQRADSPNQYGQGTAGIPYGAYDTSSIMDYANQNKVTFPSTGDINTLRYLYGSNPSVYTSSYVTDLQIITGGSSSIIAPPGFTKINVDLNRGAGGKFSYVCYTKLISTTTGLISTGINALGAFAQGSAYTSDVFGTYKPVFSTNSSGIQADCNEGAGGDFIYIVQRNSSSFNIRDVDVIYGGSDAIMPPAGWRRVNVDLNRGAGGDFIYLVHTC